MKKDLITEINRLNELMGGKTLLSEQPIPKLLRWLFKTQSDEAVELIVRKGIKNADEYSNIIRMIKNGDELPKEIAEKILKDTGTMRLLANTLVDGTTLGVKFSQAIEKLVKDIVEDSKSYDELIEIFSNKLDEASVRADWPDGLADDMMESIKKKVDDALKNKVDDVKPITNVDVGTKPIRNISKTLSEVVEQLSDEEAEKLFKYASTKKWFASSKRLFTKGMTMIRSSRKIQSETIDLIASLRKTTDAVKETAVMNKIIANVQKLQTNEKLLYQELNYWVEKYLRDSPEKDIKLIYKKLTKQDGWGKIIKMDGFFSKILGGVEFGLREYGKNFKDLRNAWVRLMTSPLTLPINAIQNIFRKEASWIAKLSKNEWSVFRKWFITSSPTGWKSVKPMYQKFGFPGAASYVTSQVARRYVSLKLISGVLTAVGASTLRFFEIENEFLDKYFSYDDYDEEKSGTVNWFNKMLSDVLEVDKSYVLPMFVAAGLGKDFLDYIGENKWADAKAVVEDKIDNIETETTKIINNKIYNDTNLPKFKKYLDDFYEEDSEETGILGFDETSFTYKYDDRTDRYTYNPITKKFNLIK